MIRINADEARRLVQGGATLLDVRTPQEYGQAHLPGAVNLPLDALQSARGCIPDHAAPVVVYCHSGARAARAAAVLEAGGWKQVYDLGPMDAWGKY